MKRKYNYSNLPMWLRRLECWLTCHIFILPVSIEWNDNGHENLATATCECMLCEQTVYGFVKFRSGIASEEFRLSAERQLTEAVDALGCRTPGCGSIFRRLRAVQTDRRHKPAIDRAKELRARRKGIAAG